LTLAAAAAVISKGQDGGEREAVGRNAIASLQIDAALFLDEGRKSLKSLLKKLSKVSSIVNILGHLCARIYYLRKF
jgi:hypothetical protein